MMSPVSELETPATQRIDYSAPTKNLFLASATLGMAAQVQPVKRTDCWPDGSETVTYYLELTKEQYEAVGGAGRIR